MRGGLNTYAYVANNPLRFTDPTGETIAVPFYCLANPSLCYAIAATACYTTYEVLRYGIKKIVTVWNEDCTDDSCSSDQSDDNKPPRGRPWTGEPGSTTEPNAGGDSRRFGKDGFPEIDYDAPHPDEAYPGNVDHAHGWGRPADGGPPTHKDRGPGAPYSPIP